MAPYLPPKILLNFCFSFLLGISAVSRETENNIMLMQNFEGQVRCSMGNVEVTYLSHSCHPGHPSYLSHPIVISATPATSAILVTLITLGVLRHPCLPSNPSIHMYRTPVIFLISVTSVILISPCNPGHLIYSCHSTHPTHASSSVRTRISDPRKWNLGELWVVFLILKISNKTICLIFCIKRQFTPEKQKFVGISTGSYRVSTLALWAEL